LRGCETGLPGRAHVPRDGARRAETDRPCLRTLHGGVTSRHRSPWSALQPEPGVGGTRDARGRRGTLPLARGPMLQGKKVIVVLPAYKAEATLERTYADLPHAIVDQVLLVDDASNDGTAHLARRLGIDTFLHAQNLG